MKNIKTLFTKKLQVPKTNKIQDIEVIQLWYVRWTARYGMFHSDVRPEVEAFTSEKQAIEFKQSLEAAFKLIKHTAGTNVTITKN